MGNANSGTPTRKDLDDTRRTGPTTGNNRGNDLPSDAKTQRDGRGVESTDPEVLEQTPGSGTTGSTGRDAPEAPESTDQDG